MHTATAASVSLGVRTFKLGTGRGTDSEVCAVQPKASIVVEGLPGAGSRLREPKAVTTSSPSKDAAQIALSASLLSR